MTRRIGIDFDNTLVCYDGLFKTLAVEMGFDPQTLPDDKQGIRDFLRSQEYGEILWQQLQALAYGPRISEAELFPGVRETLAGCIERGEQVFVVSHKSRFAAQDNGGVDLQQAAREFLAGCGLCEQLIDPQQVYFESDRAAKVARIAALGCDLFIDDLPETFAECGFPATSRKVLFSSVCPSDSLECCGSWQEISALLQGMNDPLLDLLRQQLDDPQLKLQPLPAGGNSRVQLLHSAQHAELVVKRYVADGRRRLETEYSVLGHLFTHGLPVPQPVCADSQHNYAIYRKLAGERPAVTEISARLIDQLLNFLQQLQLLRDQSAELASAAEACLIPAEVVAMIERRRKRFTSLADKRLQAFLQARVDPLTESLSQQYRRQSGADYLVPLPASERALSPSDFGFHNALLDEQGCLGFVDFEYFGWDDPAKLIADFLWHPAMTLPLELKKQFVSGCLKIYGPACKERWLRSHLLHGLKWVLLLLNEFVDADWQRRQYAGEQRQREDRLSQQLEKAEQLLARIESENERNPYVD